MSPNSRNMNQARFLWLPKYDKGVVHLSKYSARNHFLALEIMQAYLSKDDCSAFSKST